LDFVHRSEIFWNKPTQGFYAAINLQFANKSNSNEEGFVLPRSENFYNLPTKAPRVGCILLLREKV
jgi:hypothetical protein